MDAAKFFANNITKSSHKFYFLDKYFHLALILIQDSSKIRAVNSGFYENDCLIGSEINIINQSLGDVVLFLRGTDIFFENIISDSNNLKYSSNLSII